MTIPGIGGRPTGLPKTGGRKKGTPNKATLVLTEELAALAYDPLRELVSIAKDRKTPVELRVRIHSEFLPYIYPKRKAVDPSNEENRTINVNVGLDNSDLNPST